MKKLSSILALLIFPLIAGIGQTATDALRYSRLYYNGSSRFMATAGAFGAVGADFSTLSTNPAGLGLYRSSEFTLSPGFFGSFTNSEYNGTSANDFKMNLAIGNVGFVYTFDQRNKRSSGGLRSFSVAIGMNRQNNFNNRIYIEGKNHTSSMLNVFTDILNTTPANHPHDFPFDIGLAYDGGLIYFDSLRKTYRCDMPNGGVTQGQTITTWGSVNEFDISLGGNIADKLFFGMTIGIPSIRYFYQSSYWEDDSGDSIPYFNYFQYNYSLDTRGTGINFKVGLIYQPVNWLRLGGAVHTPTWYPSMMDYYMSDMYALYDSALSYPPQYSPNGMYEYQLMTPFRAIGSIAFFIGKHGFISGEYEYINYNQARMKSPGDNFSDVNATISNTYTSPLNLRVGTEWRISMFRIRGGFSYYGSPDKQSDYSARYAISGGFGVFIKRFFADIAYQWSRSEETGYLYDRTMVNPFDLLTVTHSVQTTIGFKF